MKKQILSAVLSMLLLAAAAVNASANEGTVADLPEGAFRFSFSIMGGDCGETEIYAYVKIDGTEVARSELVPITGYNNWNVAEVPSFEHPAGTEVTVGIYVKCAGEGNGAWGKIDDALLNSVP